MTERASITLVDDDESLRESLSDLLRVCDYDVHVFTSAEALLASEKWLDSDCLLLDATLPGTSGPELQAELRLRGNAIPIVFLTGYDDAELKASVIAQGAVDCLCKPFDEDELLASLNRVLGRPRAINDVESKPV